MNLKPLTGASKDEREGKEDNLHGGITFLFNLKKNWWAKKDCNVVVVFFYVFYTNMLLY